MQDSEMLPTGRAPMRGVCPSFLAVIALKPVNALRVPGSSNSMVLPLAALVHKAGNADERHGPLHTRIRDQDTVSKVMWVKIHDF
jgi:hypothetical protein